MKFRLFSLTLILLVLTPAVFAADFGIRAGRYNDAEEEFVGAELLVDLGAVNLNPNVEYSLEEDVTAGTANLDITFDIASLGRARPYLGAGAGLAYFDSDALGGETDLVGNLIGGVALHLDFLQPYAQVKYVRVFDDEENGDNQDDIAFIVGLRF